MIKKALGIQGFDFTAQSQSEREALSLFNFLANSQGSTNLHAVFKDLEIDFDAPKIEDIAANSPVPDSSEDNGHKVYLAGSSNPAAEI